MVDKKLVEWYQEQLNRGLSKDELIQILYELDYSEDEISELLSAVEGTKKPTGEVAPTPKKEITLPEEKLPDIIEIQTGKLPEKAKMGKIRAEE